MNHLHAVVIGAWLLWGLPAFADDDPGNVPATSQVEAGTPSTLSPAAIQGGGFVEPKPGQGSGNPVVGGWYLGVYGRYGTTGLLLTNVYPGTPAARVGLEVGDRIVAVNGRRIGVLPHGTRRIDTALQWSASRSGWVRLLVSDRRSGRLINVDVRLVRGSVHF
ncbi:PDZ domain (Also known as DHR or GLGF) [Stieleria maiorica]|uniref:PDZ domain (Also known as DHR or GLGF) n=1 Tax=Stieleria maiorica TaxID=2795974 RepID=A0A5B9M8P2_9BACT|nr:PDZ domain (Also known as DHR or GLGF) [Stieleria maiorica]